MAVQISEPLPGSKIELSTVHDVLLNSKRIGRVDVGYVQKNEVKSFQKYTKRKLKAGQPFGVQIFIDITGGMRASDLGKEGLKEIINAVKEKFNGLEEKDIYILELDGSKKNIIGRASNL